MWCSSQAWQIIVHLPSHNTPDAAPCNYSYTFLVDHMQGAGEVCEEKMIPDLLYYVYKLKMKGRELHMVKKEKGIQKQQLTEPKLAISRSIANTLAAEPWSLATSINPFSP